MRRAVAVGAVLLGLPHAWAQVPEIETRARLVAVPTEVRTKRGEAVYGLTESQFRLKDDGTVQRVHLDEADASEGLSLVVLVQCSRMASLEVAKLKGLAEMVEGIVGAAPHEVATVSYGSVPRVLGEFTSDAEKIGLDLAQYETCGDEPDAATLDAVQYATKMLEQHGARGRRAILLVSETRDHGSRASAQDVMESLGRTNTVVNSVSFTPARDELLRDLKDGPSGPTNYLPLFIMAAQAMRKNAPQELAVLSGGEYANFTTRKGFDEALLRVQNQIHSGYRLSFVPGAQAHEGFHTLQVSVPEQPSDTVRSRNGYWLER